MAGFRENLWCLVKFRDTNSGVMGIRNACEPGLNPDSNRSWHFLTSAKNEQLALHKPQSVISNFSLCWSTDFFVVGFFFWYIMIGLNLHTGNC